MTTIDAKRESLIFFRNLPESEIEQDYVLSSLQDFESSITLIGIGRWPAATTQIFSAIEKMLHSFYGDNVAVDLIDKYAKDHESLSGALLENVHKYRRLRNDIIHGAYSPTIDADCIKMFFVAGVPFFENILDKKIGGTIEELSTDESAYFWKIYRRTRKIFSRSKGMESPFEKLVYLSIAAKELADFPFASQQISTVHAREEFFSEGPGWDKAGLLWEHWFSDKARKDVRDPECADADVNLEDFEKLKCPICGKKEGWLSFYEVESPERENHWNFGGFARFCCFNLNCAASGFVIADPDVMKAFFEDYASEDEKKKIVADDFKSQVDTTPYNAHDW